MKSILILTAFLLSAQSFAAAGLKIYKEENQSIYVTKGSHYTLDEFRTDSFSDSYVSSCFYGRSSDIKKIIIEMAENTDIIDGEGNVIPSYDENEFQLTTEFEVKAYRNSISLYVEYQYADELGHEISVDIKRCK